MQLTLFATALVAATTASARKILAFDDATNPMDPKRGSPTIVNRCSYPVYLWSIDKELGCGSSDMQVLKTGDIYQEARYRLGTNGGISIKLSKSPTCGGKDITQLEYKIDQSGDYTGNYLDMSFVDCLQNTEDCPGRHDGFYMKSGNANGLFKSETNNEHCPIFNVYNALEAARVSYILPDDPQTKFCNMEADLELYLCGGHAPGADDESSSEPVSSPSSSASPSSEVESTPSPSSAKEEKPKPTPPAPSSTEEAFVVAAAAAVTPAPAPAGPVIKTEVVYVTEYVNRRHAHGRRHQRHRA